MKNILLFVIFLFSTSGLFAQSYQVTFDDSGNPSKVKLIYKDSLYRFNIAGSNMEDPIELTFGNEKMILKMPPVTEPGNETQMASGVNLIRFEPGELPEGDLVHDIDFSSDGKIFGVLYQHSNNIYFYDSSYQLLEIVDVGEMPTDIEMTGTKAYVCCQKSKEIYVISLNSFSVSRVFNIPENSCQIEVAPDESTIYIGCFSFMNGAVTAYNLTSGQQLYYTTQPYIHHYGYYGNQGRCFYQYARFDLTPDGSKIIAAYTGSGKPAVFDAATGNYIKSFGFGSFRGVGYSVSSDTMYILSYNNTGNVYLHRVQVSDLSVIDSIGIGMVDFLEYCDLVVSSDGQKAMTAESWTGYVYHFDFNTHTCGLIPENIFASALIRATGDRKIAAVRMFGDIHFYTLDEGNYLSALSDITSQAPGLAIAMSPVANKLVCCNDQLLYGLISTENIMGVDFDAQGILSNPWDTECGQPLEADITRSAVIITDGSKLVAVNMLTGNISFVNYYTGELDTLLNYPQVMNIKTIPGSDLLILYGYSSHSVWFVNSATYELVASLDLSNVTQCVVSPDGAYAYINSIPQLSSNGTLYKVQLNGTITIAEQLQVNMSSCSIWILGDFPEVRLNLSISPDGKMMLFPDNDPSDGPVIRIIDLELMNEMAKIPVNEYCVWDYAFSEDSRYALIGVNDDDLPLIYLNGSASFLVKYTKITGRTYSIAYNQQDDLFYILQDRDAIVKFNPVSGAGSGTIPTNSESSFQIEIDNSGKPVVRQTSNLFYMGEIYVLPGVSNEFYFDPIRNICVIPTPGPDAISVFNEVNVGMDPREASFSGFSIFPNPADEYIVAEFPAVSGYEMTIVLTDMAGRQLMKQVVECDKREVKIPLDGLAPGLYIASMKCDGIVVDTTKVVVGR